MCEHKGKRFSLLYCERTPSLMDSARARYRVHRVISESFSEIGLKEAKYNIESELGLEMEKFTNIIILDGYLSDEDIQQCWKGFICNCELRDFFDTITMLANEFSHFMVNEHSEQFITRIKRIFSEERLSYKIDEKGGVHPFVDKAFCAFQQAAIRGLYEARYDGTRTYLENCEECLSKIPVNYDGGIESVFDACENLFKLMFKAKSLNGRDAKEHISKYQERIYKHNGKLQRVNGKILDAFIAWITAAHNFRHADGTIKLVEVTEEVAIVMISQGLSYLRWLADLDKM